MILVEKDFVDLENLVVHFKSEYHTLFFRRIRNTRRIICYYWWWFSDARYATYATRISNATWHANEVFSFENGVPVEVNFDPNVIHKPVPITLKLNITMDIVLSGGKVPIEIKRWF